MHLSHFEVCKCISCMQLSKEIYLRLSIFALIFSPAEKQGQQWIIHPNKKRRLEKQRRKYIFLQKPAVETEVCQRGKGNDTDCGNTEHFHKETIHFSCRSACF